MRVVPAVLPTSRKDFIEKLALLSNISTVTRIQIDVVDGMFATPVSWPYSAKATQGTPYPELKAMVQKGEMLPHLDRIEYEIDLMCFDAERAAGAWLVLGATRLTLHAESAADLPRFLASVKKRYGAGADFAPGVVSFGLALNLATSPTFVEPYLGEIDYVQFMGIAKIGKQGQLFDSRVLERVRAFHAQHPDTTIQVDGGVSLENANALLAAGVSNLVVGSALLRAPDPAAALAAFDALKSPYGA